MIKFLQKFFNLGKPAIYEEIENPQEPNDINTTWQYKRLRKLSLSYKSDPEAITTFIYLNFNENNKFINACMNQALIDGDEVLFKEIFLRQRFFQHGNSLPYDDILDYSYKALKSDKPNIFEYTVGFFNSQYSSCISYDSDFKVRRIISYIIDNDKFEYLELLKKYQLNNFNSYITEMLDGFNKFPHEKPNQQDIDRIFIVLDKFADNINRKELSKYFYQAKHYYSKKFPDEIIELFDNFDFIKKKNESQKLLDELTNELSISNKPLPKKRIKI